MKHRILLGFALCAILSGCRYTNCTWIDHSPMASIADTKAQSGAVDQGKVLDHVGNPDITVPLK